MDTPTKISSTPTPQFKWVCLECGSQYLEQHERCEVDGSELTAIQNDSLIGTIFAERYILESLIGRGGMSSVYKARHIALDKYFALKVMHVFLLSDSQNVRRFLVESKASSTLAHPNLIAVHDFGVTSDGLPFFVMDFIDGRSLEDILEEQEFMSAEHCLRIMAQIMDGLTDVHEHGIIHRDLKPSNIMVSINSDGSERVRIVDFGIAKVLTDGNENTPNLTMTGEVVGSPFYMSPEQCMGKSLDARSDIYALGCMLYRCLSGKYPLCGSTPLETFSMQISASPAPLSQVCPSANIPPLVEDVVLKALEKDPQRRFQSVAEFRKGLFDSYEKAKEQEALQYLAARMKSRFRRFRQNVNQNLLVTCIGALLFMSSVTALFYFNPTCRTSLHKAVAPSVFSVCSYFGHLASLCNYDLAKWFLARAVREADFIGRADDRINSRDAFQKIYDHYGYRTDSKRIDGEIKAMKSDWLAHHLGIQMSKEDSDSREFLKTVPIPAEPKTAERMAQTLTSLAQRSLQRGAYGLAQLQSEKALQIQNDVLHERSKQTFQNLDLLSASLEQMGKLAEAKEQSAKLLNLASSEPPNPLYEARSALSLARIELMLDDKEQAETHFKQSINAASTAGSDASKDLKDALTDYAALLRRLGRSAEALTIEQRLSQLEKSHPSVTTPERVFR